MVGFHFVNQNSFLHPMKLPVRNDAHASRIVIAIFVKHLQEFIQPNLEGKPEC